jgi:hypothetical protein
MAKNTHGVEITEKNGEQWVIHYGDEADCRAFMAAIAAGNAFYSDDEQMCVDVRELAAGEGRYNGGYTLAEVSAGPNR